MKKVSLYYKDGSSDKEYHAQLIGDDNKGYKVNFQYGRRGNSLQTGTKTNKSLPLDKATEIFDKLISEKMSKGYTPGENGVPYTATSKEERRTGLVPQLLNPIDEDELEKYITDDNWGMQEKLDGKHVMKKYDRGTIIASNRKGLESGA